jgi:hypothetical protein
MFSTRFSTARDFQTDWYLKWKHSLGFDDRIHRKSWELAYICETLDSRDMLTEGSRGVGFGVGSEDLPIRFAERGCHILATDLLSPEWIATHKQFGGMASHDRISTRIVDMNWLHGATLTDTIHETDFDFAWSVCAMDHCGSTWLTKRFLLNQMNALRVGGIAVHTAEYTVSVGMPREGGTIYFTVDDIVDVADLMFAMGHEMAPIIWFLGDSIEDHIIDTPPYTGRVHLKAEMCGGRWGTCVGFAVKRMNEDVVWIPDNEAEGRQVIADYHSCHSQMNGARPAPTSFQSLSVRSNIM